MRAGNGDAEKRLSHILRSIQRIAVDYPVIGGAVFRRFTRRGHDFRHELIPRLVDGNAVVNPVVIAPHLLIGEPIARNQK